MAKLSAAEILKFVREHGLEGVVAKRSDSVYQPGQRTGLWSKYRIDLRQEFVVGEYVPSHLGVDSIVVGFNRDHRDLRALTLAMLDCYRALTGSAFPADPQEQLAAATAAVFRPWPDLKSCCTKSA